MGLLDPVPCDFHATLEEKNILMYGVDVWRRILEILERLSERAVLWVFQQFRPSPPFAALRRPPHRRQNPAATV